MEQRNFRSDLSDAKSVEHHFNAMYASSGYNFTRIEWTTDECKEMQRQGIDVVLERDGKSITIDEKHTLGMHDDFPIELLHVFDDGTSKPGWVSDPKHVADYIVYYEHLRKRFTFISLAKLKAQFKAGKFNSCRTFSKRNSCYETHAMYVPFKLFEHATVKAA